MSQSKIVPNLKPTESQQAFSEALLSLMRRYQEADQAAAEELVSAVNPVLARYYYALTGNSRLVEDLLQECWLRIHRARHSYRPGEPVLPWILAIARHTRVDQYRKWQRSSGRESSIDAMAHHPSSDPRPMMDTRIQANAILAAMQAIPESQREVLMMLKVSGMSVEEVARATGSSAAAVKQKAYRAYQAVRRHLSLKHDPGEESDAVPRR